MGARVLTFGGATLSDDRTKRYLLWRATGARGGKTCTFVMLNPSKADEREDDPTVRRCIGYARDWGYSTMKVVNLWSYRATDPADLEQMVKQAGVNHVLNVMEKREARGSSLDARIDAENLRYVRFACQDALVVCAWGTHGELMDRGEFVRTVLRADGVHLHALGFCKNGCPKHPVRLPKSLRPLPWLHTQCAACR